MVEKIQEYQRTLQDNVKQISPERLLWQAYSIVPLENRMLTVHEKNGHSSCFGTGHDVSLEFSKEEECMVEF
jgi:hypothetical protein